MLAIRGGAALLVISGFVSPVRGQPSRVSAPEHDYLLGVVQQWGRDAGFGDLRSQRLAAGDIEMRFWQGFGLVGTAGLVIRRQQSQWAGWWVIPHPCQVLVPLPAGDTLSEASVRAYQEEARRNCGAPPSRPIPATGVRVIGIDTVEVRSIAPANWDSLWLRLTDLGLLRVPPSVARTWVMEDGHTYVLEVRFGDSYRASVIARAEPPEGEADRLIQAIAAALDSQFIAPRSRN